MHTPTQPALPAFTSRVVPVIALHDVAQAVPLAPEPDMDEAWAEPEPFDGCTNQGQTRPSPQTVRKTRSQSSQGVAP